MLNKLRDNAFPIIAVPVVTGLVAFAIYRDVVVTPRQMAAYNAARTAAICPALLSISRSARDTLIVMRSESLCNQFVLDSIK